MMPSRSGKTTEGIMLKRSRTIELSAQERTRLEGRAAECDDAPLRTRYLIVLRSAEGRGRAWISGALSCCESLVSRVRRRWRAEGEAGLIDRREDNGQRKAGEDFVGCVRWILTMSPRDFGHRRPTWTQRLLITTAAAYTGVTVSRTTMGRVLAALGARRGRPKPMAPCPWSRKARQCRLRMIHRLVGTLPPDQAAVWEDEADLDLNPRIGPDWMLPGTQRVVMTPGKNVKRYLAGAMDAASGRVTWLSGPKKDSGLFIALLKKLLRVYAHQRAIHVILDNYAIHTSRRTRAWLSERGSRLRLHFLPPYCPDDNRIERSVWRELHAGVTYNHTCQTIGELLHEADVYLRAHNRRASAVAVDGLREAI
jgi:hypothetical protein